MKGSFGGSYGLGRPGGGFNGGDGGLMRSVARVMRTRINGLQEPFPSSSGNSSNSNSSSSNFNAKKSSNTRKNRSNSGMAKYGLSVTAPESSNNGNSSSNGIVFPGPGFYEEVDYDDGEIVDYDYDGEWECLEDFYDPVFGVVPSTFEVNHAILSLQQFLHPAPPSQSGTEEILSDVGKDMSSPKSSATNVLERASSYSSTRSSLDWIEPSTQLYDQRLASSYGWEKVYDAFHLLQTEPSVQKMVVSLSSDKAVWDAVLNNATVREIRDSYLNGAEASNTDKNSDPSKENSNVLLWLMDHLKGKLMEVVGNITQFVGGVFNPPNPDKPGESLDFSEKLKSSFMLTILVLLIVVVTRGSKA